MLQNMTPLYTGTGSPADWAGWLDTVPVVTFAEAQMALRGGGATNNDDMGLILREAGVALSAHLQSLRYFTLLADRAISHTVDEIAALRFFTSDGFRTINAALRSARQDAAGAAPMARLLVSAMEKLKPNQYRFAERGEAAPAEVFDHPERYFATGQRVPMMGFCSFSTSAQQAQRFASAAHELVYVVRNLTAVSLKDFSVHPEECEVLPMPTAIFIAQSWHLVEGKLFVFLSHAVDDSSAHRYLGDASRSAAAVGVADVAFDSRLVNRDCVQDLAAKLRATASVFGKHVFILEGGHGVGKSCTASMAVRDAMLNDATSDGSQRVAYNAVLRLDGSKSLLLSLRQAVWKEVESCQEGREPSVLELWSAWLDENSPAATDTSSKIAVIIEDMDDGIGIAAQELLSIIESAPLRHRNASEHFIITSHTPPRTIASLMGTVTLAVGRLKPDEVVAMLDAAKHALGGRPIVVESLEVADFLLLCRELGDMQAFFVSRLIDDFVVSGQSSSYPEWANGLRNKAMSLQGRGDFSHSLSLLYHRLLASLSNVEQRRMCTDLMETHYVLHSASIPLFVMQQLLCLELSPQRRTCFVDLLRLLEARGVVTVATTAVGVKSVQVHQWHWSHLHVSDETRTHLITRFEGSIKGPTRPTTEHQKRSWLTLFSSVPVSLTTVVTFQLAYETACFTFTAVQAVYDKLQTATHLDGDRLNFRENLCGYLLRYLGRYEEARQVLTASLASLRADMGAGAEPDRRCDAEVAETLYNLGSVLLHLEQETDALEKLSAALEIRRRVLPEASNAIAFSLNNVGAALEKLSRPEEALQKHADALEIWRRVLPQDDENIAQSLNNAASVLFRLGRYEEAQQKFNESLEIRHRALPNGHPAVGASLSNVAGVLVKLGRYGEALQHYQEALEIQRHALRDGHPDTATTRNDVGDCFYVLEQFEEALTSFTEALAMRRHALPCGHPAIATTLNNQGSTLTALRRYDEAQEKLDEALTMRRRTLPSDHSDIADSLNNIGTLLNAQKQYSEALEKHSEALSMRRRLLREDHLNIAESLNNVGSTLANLERWDEALPKFLEALSVYRRALPGNHLKTAIALSNTAAVLYALERYDEALHHHTAALEMQRVVRPEGHPDIIASLSAVAELSSAVGQQEEALRALEELLQLRRRTSTNNNIEIAALINLIGATLHRLKRHEAALAMFEEALKLRCELLPATDAGIAISLTNVGAALSALQRYDDALDKYRQSLAIWRSAHPDNVLAIATSLTDIGSVLCSLRRFEPALEAHNEALEIRRRALPENSPPITASLHTIGCILKVQRRYEASLAMFVEVLANRRQTLPEDHPSVAAALNQVASVLALLGR